jgi:general secretion pathway protein E
MSENDTREHKLTLAEVLGMLVNDGMIEPSQVDAMLASLRGQRNDSHPLLLIADQNWRSHTPPNKLLHLEALTEWIAKRTGLEYFHIDPHCCPDI